MRAIVFLWTWLALRVRFDQKAAEIGDLLVDLVRLFDPPLPHGGVRGIGRALSANFDRRTEARGQPDLHAVRPKHVGKRLHLCDGRRREDLGARVHVVEDGSVDAERRIRPRVVRVPRRQRAGQRVPIPERATGVATFDRPVGVVPVVQQAVLDAGTAAEREIRERAMTREMAKQRERAVKCADFAVAGDDDDVFAVDVRRLDQVTFRAERGDPRSEWQRVDRDGPNGTHDHGACIDGGPRAYGGASEAAQAGDQLGRGSVKRRRRSAFGFDHLLQPGAVFGKAARKRYLGITQPQIGARFIRRDRIRFDVGLAREIRATAAAAGLSASGRTPGSRAASAAAGSRAAAARGGRGAARVPVPGCAAHTLSPSRAAGAGRSAGGATRPAATAADCAVSGRGAAAAARSRVRRGRARHADRKTQNCRSTAANAHGAFAFSLPRPRRSPHPQPADFSRHGRARPQSFIAALRPVVVRKRRAYQLL
jgi:hypothetical protein